jgi:hypothetical protein
LSAKYNVSDSRLYNNSETVSFGTFLSNLTKNGLIYLYKGELFELDDFWVSGSKSFIYEGSPYCDMHSDTDWYPAYSESKDNVYDMQGSCYHFDYRNINSLTVFYSRISVPVPPKYSEVCPYTYKLYYRYGMGLDGYYHYNAYLDILKSGSLVFSEYIWNYAGFVDISAGSTINYAKEKLKTYVDNCLANQKIKTTCCILVCCEPNKYELI